MIMRLKNLVALVTGGAGGLGTGICKALAEEGANVAINYLKGADDPEITDTLVRRACKAIREAGCKDLIVQADVASEDHIGKMFADVINEWGRLDILDFLVSQFPAVPASGVDETEKDQSAFSGGKINIWNIHRSLRLRRGGQRTEGRWERAKEFLDADFALARLRRG